MNTSPATTVRRLTIAAAALGASAVVLAAAPGATAATPAGSTVTIKAEGVDLSGTVTSTREACMDERKVIVFKQVGKRGGGDDVKFAMDTAELVNGVGVWSTGNTGTEGKFYAKAGKTAECKVAFSKTVKAVRND
jgi:hypothetical protein